ncbi:MAG: helix-turn-helix domain-containing protein [Porticoccaceae bacterium]
MTQANVKAAETKLPADTGQEPHSVIDLGDTSDPVVRAILATPSSEPPTIQGKKTRSTGSEQSITRILDAAMESASRQGLHNLSMSDVCRIAGVARGTLYRYFPSKEVLLESLGQRTRYQTETGIREAAAGATTGSERLRAVVNFLIKITNDTKARDILEVEPLFFMEFLRRNMPNYGALISDVLGPFYDEIELAIGHKIDRKLVSEMILRLQISYIFLPDDQPAEVVLQRIFAAIEEFK